METQLPVKILCTKALSNAAREFIHQQDWLVDIIAMIETHGVITTSQISDFLAHFNNPGEESCLIFSSENGVKWLKWGLDKFGFSIPKGLKALCVGEKTAATAAEWLEAEVIRVEKNSADLLESLKNTGEKGKTFHFFCGNKRLDTLPEGLREKGFCLKEYIIYETHHTPHKLIRDYDVIMFFSPSAVESYFMVNIWMQETLAVSIGHTTSGALQKAGVENILVAKETSEASMLQTLQEYLKERSK